MPTYVCTSRSGALDDAKRAAIAHAISMAHSDATGAPPYFVQVVFVEIDVGRRYLGGAPTDNHIWIRGDIRAGRSIDARTQLMRTMMTEVAAILKLGEEDIWVYLNELEPTDMIEYGHVLPQPGEERAWFDGLPETLKNYLVGLGTKREDFTL